MREWRGKTRTSPNDRYNRARDISPAFLERVFQWIQTTGEVLVLLRYLRAAGAVDFALCRSPQDFEAVVRAVPLGTDIEVFRDRQLPLRGTVDDEFICAALESIEDGRDYLLLTLETEAGNPISAFHEWDCAKSELSKSLRRLWGKQIAVGHCPSFHVDDHEALTSASKGGIDGPR